jgi:hypothetical protein
MLIKSIIICTEASHRDHKISYGRLELLPIIVVVEHSDCKHFNLNLVQIWEELNDAVGYENNCKFFVAWISMGLSVELEDGLANHVRLNHLNELLNDSALKFKAREMLAVSQNFNDFIEKT